MVLGFKDRFEPMILDGSKRHTIRGGKRWRVGMRADLFLRARQRDMRLLFRAPVVRVESIAILNDQGSPIIRINGDDLDAKEADLLAWHDGFRHATSGDPHQGLGYGGCFQLMLEFWRGRLPFSGQLIHWDYAERFTDVTHTCYRLSRSMAKGTAA